MRIEEGFQQAPYPVEHPYTEDPVLPSLLKRILPNDVKTSLDIDLTRLGHVLVNDIRPLAPLLHPATLTQYDEWGRRIDRLHTSEAWRALEEFAIKEGYVAIAYEKKHREYSRTIMFARNMVMTGDSHALFGTKRMKKELSPRFLSRDPANACLSGQWMTERPGGSDVSQTETVAVPTQGVSTDLGSPYILDGFKWFSSAAEGHIAVALARTGTIAEGARGLSLFLVPLRMGAYTSPLHNGVYMHRLKQKVGTYGVPTAELELRGTRAWLLGAPGEGVRCIVRMLNITRVHSAVHSIGSLQAALRIARAYARVRAVEGGRRLLANAPLHVAGLADSSLLYRALTHLAFGAVVLLGRSECGVATDAEEARLRLLTPTIKAYAAEHANVGIEQAMGALGGQGYMEETGIGRLIRDAMVEKIWEGAINVCALDLTRAITKEPLSVEHYLSWAHNIISAVSPSVKSLLAKTTETLATSLTKLPIYFRETITNPLLPCVVLNYFAIVSSALYLLEHASWACTTKEPTQEVDIEAVRRWVEEGELAKVEREIELVRADDGRRVGLNTGLVYGPHANFSAKL
ncbi:hypothetical protein EIP86_000211 [Pleurotus ostreatoroseus]|nr:hypothetical protein EIP86_000211 [Pleurotus ostreatoroseus]